MNIKSIIIILLLSIVTHLFYAVLWERDIKVI